MGTLDKVLSNVYNLGRNLPKNLKDYEGWSGGYNGDSEKHSATQYIFDKSEGGSKYTWNGIFARTLYIINEDSFGDNQFKYDFQNNFCYRGITVEDNDRKVEISTFPIFNWFFRIFFGGDLIIVKDRKYKTSKDTQLSTD